MHDRDGWPFDTAHIELTRCGPDPEARHSVLLSVQMALSHPRPAHRPRSTLVRGIRWGVL